MVVIRRASVPRQNLGIHNEEYSVVQGANKNFPVSLVKHRIKIINVTAEMIADLCHDGVFTIGKTKLGICQSEIGTRSIRSGAAMAMYLAGVPVFSIILIQRWSSTAFLKYIWKQVQEFSQGASPQNDRSTVVQSCPKPNRTEPDGVYSW